MRKPDRPVKVTAHMATPICGHVPMLESILCDRMGRHMPAIRVSRHGDRHTGRNWNGYENVPIPVASSPMGGWQIPRASSPIFAVKGEEVMHVTSPAGFDLDAMRPGGANKINVTGGEFKAIRLPRRIIITERVVWFAVARSAGGRTTAASTLRQRLGQVDAIGQDTGIGHGVVSRWEVEQIEDDWSWYAPGDDGPVLMRPLPQCDELPPSLCGAQAWFDRPAPPYHDKASAVEVVRPC